MNQPPLKEPATQIEAFEEILDLRAMNRELHGRNLDQLAMIYQLRRDIRMAYDEIEALKINAARKEDIR